jgi:GAF domain-containing protein
VPGAQHASVSSVRRRREVTTRASTNDLPVAVDRAQYETGQGPCLDTLYERRTARIPDMGAEERWPAFAARAQGLGVGSMLSVQLFVQGEDLGALNLVNEETNAFSEESEHVALLFASHAAVAMSNAQRYEQVLGAVEFRDLIGQAKGILMERFKITGDRAFQVLTRVSQRSNRKLRDIATELVEQGDLEDLTGGEP